MLPVVDLSQDGGHKHEPVAAKGVVLLLRPSHQLQVVLVGVEQVTGVDGFQDGHTSSAQERHQVVEGNVIASDACTGEQAVFGRCGPLCVLDGRGKSLLFDAQPLDVCVNLGDSVG